MMKWIVARVNLGSGVLLLLLTACAVTESPSITNSLSPGTAWVAQSPEWIQEADQVYMEAHDYLERAHVSYAGGHWYVVLDVDETILNNVAYQIERDLRGESFSASSWYAWTQKEAATAVPGSLAFLKAVADLGGKVALVTNRRDVEQLATENNLAALGLIRGRDFQVLLTRGAGSSSNKDNRFGIVPQLLEVQGYEDARALAYLGDGKGDKPSDRATDSTWQFFCIDQGAMYGDFCAEVPRTGR
ncbi:MAG: HAD family acid phosphatase [Pseudomonadota bacterium]